MSKIYWDSSALIEALQDGRVRKRLAREESSTRVHTLAEVFSTLTGGRLGFRCDAGDAAAMIQDISGSLHFVELDAPATQGALKECRKRGVRGGLVHDYLHLVAAGKADAERLLTLNIGDFNSLRPDMPVEAP